MKIIKEITVVKEATNNIIVDRCICSKCNCVIKEIEVNKRKNRKAIFSKIIYVDKCKNCENNIICNEIL